MKTNDGRFSVVIPTLNRLMCLRRCLESIESQRSHVDEVIVVDAAASSEVRDTVLSMGWTYVPYVHGKGQMTSSRNIGLYISSSDYTTFLDDDAYVRPGFFDSAKSVLDAGVDGVTGHTLNIGQRVGTAPRAGIGKYLGDGLLTASFDSLTKSEEVDHMIGCNMTYRTTLLKKVGGFIELSGGGCSTFDEVEVCNVLKAFYSAKLLYSPGVNVDHEGAPRTVLHRFTSQYYFGVTLNATILHRMCRSDVVARRQFWRTMQFTPKRRYLGVIKGYLGGMRLPQQLILKRSVVDGTRLDSLGKFLSDGT